MEVRERCVGVYNVGYLTVCRQNRKGIKGAGEDGKRGVAGSGTYRAAMAQVLDVRTYNHDVLVGSGVVIGEQGTRKMSIINDESS